MTDYVIDTNVWVNADKNIERMERVERDCAQKCDQWLGDFVKGDSRLVVDASQGYKPGILWEYRKSIGQHGKARSLLNELARNWSERIADVEIEWDEDNFAVLPDALRIEHREDRKFVAVVIEYRKDHSTPPIINSTDTDWRKENEKLEKGGIVLLELCSAFIDAHYKG